MVSAASNYGNFFARGGSKVEVPGTEQLEGRAAQLGQHLIEQKQVLVTAESCTGGWIAQTVTAVAGSSEWFDRGFVTYSNRAKMEVLGVDATTLDDWGAVSEQTAAAMAAGALRAAGADYSVAVTGVAGPGGGSTEKPVGTVWFAWGLRGCAPITAHHCFAGDRAAVRAQTVAIALDGLIDLAERGS